MQRTSRTEARPFLGGAVAGPLTLVVRRTASHVRRAMSICWSHLSRAVAAFVARVAPAFLVERDDIETAIALAPTLGDAALHRATCNLVHRASFFRVDILVASARPYEQAQLARRVAQTVTIDPERTAYFVSPEDIVVQKLDWYRMSQGVLDRQWGDVRAVLLAQGETLDRTYMHQWAQRLGLVALLNAVLAGLPPPRLQPPEPPQQGRFYRG